MQNGVYFHKGSEAARCIHSPVRKSRQLSFLISSPTMYRQYLRSRRLEHSCIVKCLLQRVVASEFGRYWYWQVFVHVSYCNRRYLSFTFSSQNNSSTHSLLICYPNLPSGRLRSFPFSQYLADSPVETDRVSINGIHLHRGSDGSPTYKIQIDSIHLAALCNDGSGFQECVFVIRAELCHQGSIELRMSFLS